MNNWLSSKEFRNKYRISSATLLRRVHVETVKTNEIKNNIINPDINDFRKQLEKQLEEFDLLFDGKRLSELYYEIKTKKDHHKLNGDHNKVRSNFECVKHNVTVKMFFSNKSMTLLIK